MGGGPPELQVLNDWLERNLRILPFNLAKTY